MKSRHDRSFTGVFKVISKWAEKSHERRRMVVFLSRAQVSLFLCVSFFFSTFNLPPSLHQWVFRIDRMDVMWLQWNMTSGNSPSELNGLHAVDQTVNKVDSILISRGDFTSSHPFLSLRPIHLSSSRTTNVRPTSLPNGHALPLQWCCRGQKH